LIIKIENSNAISQQSAYKANTITSTSANTRASTIKSDVPVSMKKEGEMGSGRMAIASAEKEMNEKGKQRKEERTRPNQFSSSKYENVTPLSYSDSGVPLRSIYLAFHTDQVSTHQVFSLSHSLSLSLTHTLSPTFFLLQLLY
jgi:hypothetical protein